jgi:hypothetical protein
MRYAQSQRIWRAKYLSRNLWEQTKENTPKKQTNNNSGVKQDIQNQLLLPI